MGSERLGESLGISEELIKKSCYLSLKAQNSPNELFYVENGPSDVVFSFPGSWSVDGWFSGEKSFGETKINPFRSMRSIGNDEVAALNQAFLQKFELVLQNSKFEHEVQVAMNQNKRIIFTGHSAGGPIAVLATIWFLEKYLKAASGTAFCVTFGSPLIGDHILSHALRRENWSCYFIHFVLRYDIVPRILLAPLSSIGKEQFEKILRFFNPKSPHFASQFIGTEPEAFHFYTNVMRNASSLASHAACKLMGSTNLLLETVTNFIKLSPYRPFGTYIFCTGNGKLVVLKNPEAVLQLLFYSCQLSSAAEGAVVAHRCLKEHLGYENELLSTEGSLDMQDVVYLNKLEELPLASDGALNDLGLSARARLCLRAAGELEQQKLRNQDQIDSKVGEIMEGIKGLENYRAMYEHQLGYYNAFKVQKDQRDFKANVSRLVLAGIWDEIIEMLKRYELPDGFESREEWIERGTKFRRLVEPLDIANYYRHSKNEDTGPYLTRGRPRRYKYTQRWREHDLKLPTGSCGESCFWAEVEELHKHTGNNAEVDMIRDRVLKVQREVGQWIRDGELAKDVLLDESTFVKWWMALPQQLKSESIVGLMNDRGSLQYNSGTA